METLPVRWHPWLAREGPVPETYHSIGSSIGSCGRSGSQGSNVSVSTALPDPEWDGFVDASPGGHHVQTSLWAQVKAKHGWQAIRLTQRREGQIVAGCQLLVRRFSIGSVAYCSRGPLTMDRDKSATALISAIETLARHTRILYVKVQPPAGGTDIEPLLLGRGFVTSDLPAAPVATVRVELQRNPDEILASMRASARSNIRKATRKGITVRESGLGGLPTFGELLKDTSRRQRFPPYPLDYYADILMGFGCGDRAELLLAECGQRVLSGALIIGYGDTVVYKAGAWSGERSDLHPNELMHWYAMQWARERGYRYYDFEGIPDSVARAKLVGANLPEEGTRGATRFKLGMGGKVTLCPWAYDRSFQPLLVWPARVLAPRLGHLRSAADRIAGRG